MESTPALGAGAWQDKQGAGEVRAETRVKSEEETEEMIVLGQAQEAGKPANLWSGSGESPKPPAPSHPNQQTHALLGSRTSMVLQSGTLDLLPPGPTPTPAPASYQPQFSFWCSGVTGWPGFDGLPFPQAPAF